MTFVNLKTRKAQLFERIMKDKYAGVKTPAFLIAEYRFLQREERRMVKAYKLSA